MANELGFTGVTPAQFIGGVVCMGGPSPPPIYKFYSTVVKSVKQLGGGGYHLTTKYPGVVFTLLGTG